MEENSTGDSARQNPKGLVPVSYCYRGSLRSAAAGKAKIERFPPSRAHSPLRGRGAGGGLASDSSLALGQCCDDLEVRGHFNLPHTRGTST